MKARYNFWSDRPRNVTRREYDHYQMIVMGIVFTGAISVITAFLAVSGFNERLGGTENIPNMSVAEALAYDQQQPTDLVKLQGFLVANEQLTMPDEPNLEIIRGRVVLKAETEQNEELIEEILWEWEQEAKQVFLSDGATQVPLAFDLAKIPLKDDRQARAKIKRVGNSARTSKPVALEYAEQIYPLSDPFKEESSISAEVIRQFIPHGQSVIIFAAVESTPNGGRLIDPLGQRLKVLMGTETEIRQTDSRMRIIYALLTIVSGISAFFLKKRQGEKWQEFVERSHQ